MGASGSRRNLPQKNISQKNHPKIQIADPPKINQNQQNIQSEKSINTLKISKIENSPKNGRNMKMVNSPFKEEFKKHLPMANATAQNFNVNIKCLPIKNVEIINNNQITNGKNLTNTKKKFRFFSQPKKFRIIKNVDENKKEEKNSSEKKTNDENKKEEINSSEKKTNAENKKEEKINDIKKEEINNGGNKNEVKKPDPLLLHQIPVKESRSNTPTKLIVEKKPAIEETKIDVKEIDNLFVGSEQKIYLLNYNKKKFPNHPRTVYFNNEYNIVPKSLMYYYGARPTNKNFVESYTIKDNHYFLGIRTYQYGYECITKTMKSNQLIFLKDFGYQNLIWIDPGKFNIDLINHIKKYQKYNHFPFWRELGTKNKLFKHYKDMKTKFPNDFNYMLESYILPQDKDTFLEKIGGENYTITPDNMWIIKPFSLFGGEGVKLMETVNELPDEAIVVKYISRPFLVNSKKIDLRLYALVTGYAPLKIYLYDDGIVRFASENYSLDQNNLKNSFIHLTNVCINRKFRKDGKVTKWRLKEFISYLQREKRTDFNNIWIKIKDLITKAFISITEFAIKTMETDYSHINYQNLYELYGFDVLLDNKLEPHLLEMNANPMLTTIRNIDLEMKTNLISDILNIVGLLPFDHTNPEVPLDKPVKYKDKVDEAVYESLCEFSRPQGGWTRIFPQPKNINYYGKFLENPGDANLKLWSILQNKK